MDLTEPLRQKSQELRNLEEKYSKNLKNIEELRNLLTEKDEVIKKFKNQSSAHSRLIYDYQCNDEENRLKIKELTENLNQVSNELRKTQDENYRKQHNLEVALFKLKGILEKEKEMENRIQYLEEQNLVLSYRAGIGFENLTPRPSFIGIENLMMEFPQSTKKKVQKILEIAGNLVNSSKSSSSIRKKNKKVSLKNTTKITIESNSEHGDF
jgi:vacuolar-type H+-ATPase subunit I/STV1